MNALINDADACKNNNITQLIFDWGVLNNKTGNYINTMLGIVAGVNWESTTTPGFVNWEVQG